jgi:hypothetical protein
VWCDRDRTACAASLFAERASLAAHAATRTANRPSAVSIGCRAIAERRSRCESPLARQRCAQVGVGLDASETIAAHG